MGCGCITHLINGFHGGIDCGIKTDRIFCTCDVQIDCSGNTNGIDAKSGKLLRTLEGAVSAHNDHAVNTMLPADFGAFLLSLCGLKFRAAGRI